jgi:NHL repeat
MIATRIKITLSLATAMATIIIAGATAAHAATPPIKEVLSSHIGWEVDKTTKGALCTVASQHECQEGTPSSEPGGFEYPEGVAGAANGNVYVGDRGNNRVQEFTSAGAFVLMFGKGVNATTGGNICTEEEIKSSGVKCKAGVEGTAAGQFQDIQSLTIDSTSGDVYVQEGTSNNRVEQYTPDGQFVWMVGKEVNANTGGNICTEEEVKSSGVKCKAGVHTGSGSTEPAAFNFIQSAQNLLAAGGPADLLYVGDEARVQEFEADGKVKGKVPLPAGNVGALAVDKTGDVYLMEEPPGSLGIAGNVIQEFNPSGKEITQLSVLPRETNARAAIFGLASNSAGQLAMLEAELPRVGENKYRGLLYNGSTGRRITDFTLDPRYGASSVTFNGKGELYTVSTAAHDALAYFPVPVGELLTTPQECTPGVDHESDATLDCTLNGEVDAWGVKATEVWVEWGRTPLLGEKTEPPLDITNLKSEGEEEPLVKVSPAVKGMRPNETVYYQLAAHDQNLQTELMTSERASFQTSTVAPRILGEPSVSFVHFSSAVMFGELNPENTNTKYEFQYGQCESLESCLGMAQTAAQESSAYGRTATTLEATGLQPSTPYRYRLFAVNEAGEPAVDENGGHKIREGEFTTAPAPVPQASTGPASAMGATSATISGTVNPDGQAATYTFELGLYAGAATQYGVVFSGPAGAGSVPVEEKLVLSGLQPGTEYAYRIVVKGASGEAKGDTATFAIAGLPSVLVVPSMLAQLAVPPIAFPREPAKVTSLTRAQQLARALKACKKRSRKQRAACQKQARKKYPKSKQANHRKKG